MLGSSLAKVASLRIHASFISKCSAGWLSDVIRLIRPSGACRATQYLRADAAEQTLFAVVCHITPVVRPNYRVGVPRRGFWKEIINTISGFYGGGGLGNDGGRATEDVSADGHSQSIRLTLPPLSTTIFKWTAEN